MFNKLNISELKSHYYDTLQEIESLSELIDKKKEYLTDIDNKIANAGDSGNSEDDKNDTIEVKEPQEEKSINNYSKFWVDDIVKKWVKSYQQGDLSYLKSIDKNFGIGFTNYDKSRGLDKHINSLKFLSHGQSRTSLIDDKEPRPNLKGSDFSDIKVQEISYYLFLQSFSKNYSNSEKQLLINKLHALFTHYANDKYLDFSNTKRFHVAGKYAMMDQNPSFFIACWLNTLLNIYDFTQASGFEFGDLIIKWLMNALDFYHKMAVNGSPFRQFGDVETCHTGNSWYDKIYHGKPYEGSKFESYGFNESFSNRWAVIWRFIGKGAILFYKHDPKKYQKIIDDTYHWFDCFLMFGCFSNNLHTDMARGGRDNPQQGLQYSSIAIGAMIDIAAAYERFLEENRNVGQKISMFDFISTHIPDSLSSRPWYKHFNERTSLLDIIKEYCHLLDNVRDYRWGSFKINGYGTLREDGFLGTIESDNIFSLANYFYKDSYLKEVYKRERYGMKELSNNPSDLGSYDIRNGIWGGHIDVKKQFFNLE